jgi:hypothetical protein
MHVTQPGRSRPDACGSIDQRDGFVMATGLAGGVSGIDQPLRFIA